MVFRERPLPKPPARPAWMSTSVVDPAWLKANPLTVTDVPDPFQYLANLQDKALKKLFDPALFRYENDKPLTEPARDLREALTEFLQDVADSLPGEVAGIDVTKLRPSVATLMGKIRDQVSSVLQGVEQEDLSHWDFARGIWEQFILMGESDITTYEMLDAAFENVSESERKEMLARYWFTSTPTPIP